MVSIRVNTKVCCCVFYTCFFEPARDTCFYTMVLSIMSGAGKCRPHVDRMSLTSHPSPKYIQIKVAHAVSQGQKITSPTPWDGSLFSVDHCPQIEKYIMLAHCVQGKQNLFFPAVAHSRRSSVLTQSLTG